MRSGSATSFPPALKLLAPGARPRAQPSPNSVRALGFSKNAYLAWPIFTLDFNDICRPALSLRPGTTCLRGSDNNCPRWFEPSFRHCHASNPQPSHHSHSLTQGEMTRQGLQPPGKEGLAPQVPLASPSSGFLSRTGSGLQGRL